MKWRDVRPGDMIQYVFRDPPGDPVVVVRTEVSTIPNNVTGGPIFNVWVFGGRFERLWVIRVDPDHHLELERAVVGVTYWRVFHRAVG